MEKQNKKQKSKKSKVILAFSVIITIVIFFLIKIVNALVNNTNILLSLKSIGLIPPANLSLPNIIDYVANIILLIVLPILILTLIILIIKSKSQSKNVLKKEKKELENETILQVENFDIDDYPHYEEDKTFFDEINNENINDLTLLQQRAKSDGSILIKENLSELVKNAQKIKNYAILNNINVDEVVLEEMTKKELILFMKKIGNEIRENEYKNLNSKDSKVDQAILIMKNDNQDQNRSKTLSKNKNIIEAGKITQKKSLIRKNKITKKNLIDSIFVSNENKLTKVKIKKIVDSLFELMESNLIKEDSVIRINNFAKFSTVLVNEATMRNIKTGELKLVPSHKAIKFKSLKGLKEKLNNEKI
ncbi:HU family DNA-binding protein [Mesoplasma tabanidae]|uniref:Uncharacterized protein n=1 Tax=Mesoplasma tabanidae TaxID=219745 RepID=A0A2K8P766_9MOLU|nr:HU family DNA-binding protein [Mesoplasma tabanidae]ATZ21583.1 hypothetical protein MTABA_v1c03820 [Mesoplasma tabanidae]